MRSLQANKMVLVYNQFRLTTVIEAAMEIAGMQAAQKRLHVRLMLAPCSDRGDVRGGVKVADNVCAYSEVSLHTDIVPATEVCQCACTTVCLLARR